MSHAMMLSARRGLAAASRLSSRFVCPVQPLSFLAGHDPSVVRNVAIIAHVDHGKTTLVDRLIQEGDANESGVAKEVADGERVMDSGGMEKERGITIMAKATRVDWRGHVLNIVDTPGHSDFGGEVERVLSMVEGAILVVDATEGVMSQTKFVVSRALRQGLKLVVVLNKVDRETARLNGEVESEIFDLLCNHDATDEQLDFPVVFASAKNGWACLDMSQPDRESSGMVSLLETVIEHISPPCGAELADPARHPFSFVVNNLSTDPFIGRLVTGRVHTGAVKPGDKVKVMKMKSPAGATGESDGGEAASDSPLATVSHVFAIRNGTEREAVPAAQAGDIVVLAGVPTEMVGVSDTVASPEVSDPLPTVPLTPPTICMSFGANDGPLAGRSGGTFLNSNQVKSRLHKEVENNVTIVLKPSPTDSDQLEVHARGELQLGILLEEMRREGFELTVSPPRILSVKCPETGSMLEPVEEVTIDVGQEHSGGVIEKLQNLRVSMSEYKDMGDRVRLVFDVPSRLLMGVRADLRNSTRGSAVVNAMFKEYAAPEGQGRNYLSEKGKLVSMEQGPATAYALNLVEARGTLFIDPGTEVYEGMVIGEHSRPGDLEVNPCKGKKLTNVRASGTDENIKLAPPRRMTLEDYITYMSPDEVLEITPDMVRLRKRHLNASDRAKAQKEMKQASQQRK